MNDVVQSYLSSRFPIVGVAAYSLFSSDQLLETQCLSKSLYPTTTEEMINRVIKSSRELLPSGKRSAQYCWTFEAHRVYLASRSDGFCLVLLVENNPGVQQFRVQETLQGFLDLSDN